MRFIINSRSNITDCSFFEKLVILVLLLHPILQIYRFWGPIGFDSLADILVIFLFFIQKRKIIAPKQIKHYLIYAYIVSILALNSWKSIIPIGYILNAAMLLIYMSCIKYKNLMYIYTRLAVVVLAFLFIQEITLMTAGRAISGILNFLPIAIAEESDLWLLNHNESLRQSSFFSEPAHLAQFLAPLLCYYIFSNYKRKYVICAILILALLITQSGNAIVCIVVILALYIYTIIKVDRARGFLFAIFLLFIVIVGGLFYLTTEGGQMIAKRIITVSDAANPEQISSAYMRLFRGYDLFGRLPLINQIVGLGDKQNLLDAIRHSSIRHLFGDNDLYFNGISYILLYSGFVGLFLFGRIYKYLWQDNTLQGRTYIVLWIVLMLMSATYLNSTSAIFLLLANSFKNKGQEKLNNENISYNTNLQTR